MPLKYAFLPKWLCFTLLANTVLWADTIVLKSGERIDAKIIRTTDTTVEAEVKMSASITDLRTIQKTDIASIEKPDPAEAAFAALKNVGPGPNSLSPSDYNTIIHNQLNAFVGQYPASPHLAEVKAMVAAMEKEKERVAFGEVKVDNVWYTPDELEKQRDQVNATLLLQQIKSVAQTGDTLGALNLFTKLEKTYPGSRAYPDAVDFAMQLLPNVQSEIRTKRNILANDLAERKKGLDLLPDFRKAPLIAAAAAEDARSDAALDAAIKSGTKWNQIYPRHAKSIDALQTALTTEATRMAAIKTAPMHASIAAADEAKKQLAAGQPDAAAAALTKATSLWSANAMIKNLTAEVALAKATPTPTPAPTPTPTPTPTATPKPAAKPVAKPAPATTSAATPAPAPADEPSFFATIPGAATILGVVAGVAGIITLAMKAKGKKNASGPA